MMQKPVLRNEVGARAWRVCGQTRGGWRVVWCDLSAWRLGESACVVKPIRRAVVLVGSGFFAALLPCGGCDSGLCWKMPHVLFGGYSTCLMCTGKLLLPWWMVKKKLCASRCQAMGSPAGDYEGGGVVVRSTTSELKSEILRSQGDIRGRKFLKPTGQPKPLPWAAQTPPGFDHTPNQPAVSLRSKAQNRGARSGSRRRTHRQGERGAAKGAGRACQIR